MKEIKERLSIICTLQKMLFDNMTTINIKFFYHFLTASHRKNTEYVDVYDKDFLEFDYISKSDCFNSINKLIESKVLEKVTDKQYRVLW
jgi:hypothetical protein